jgi:hypothetical protein
MLLRTPLPVGGGSKSNAVGDGCGPSTANEHGVADIQGEAACDHGDGPGRRVHAVFDRPSPGSSLCHEARSGRVRATIGRLGQVWRASSWRAQTSRRRNEIGRGAMKQLWQKLAVGLALALSLVVVAVIVAFGGRPADPSGGRIVPKAGWSIVKDADHTPIPSGAVTVVRCKSDGSCVTRVK